MLHHISQSSEAPLSHTSFLDEWAQRFTGIVFKKIAEDGYLEYVLLFHNHAIKEFNTNLKIEAQDIILDGDCLKISEAKAGLIYETLDLVEKAILSEDCLESNNMTSEDMTFEMLLDKLKNAKPREKLPSLFEYKRELEELFKEASTPSTSRIIGLFIQKVGNIIRYN